jgi:hypothetical protein
LTFSATTLMPINQILTPANSGLTVERSGNRQSWHGESGGGVVQHTLADNHCWPRQLQLHGQRSNWDNQCGDREHYCYGGQRHPLAQMTPSNVSEDSGDRMTSAMLLANDFTGPANESSQTLTIIAVSQAEARSASSATT